MIEKFEKSLNILWSRVFWGMPSHYFHRLKNSLEISRNLFIIWHVLHRPLHQLYNVAADGEFAAKCSCIRRNNGCNVSITDCCTAFPSEAALFSSPSRLKAQTDFSDRYPRSLCLFLHQVESWFEMHRSTMLYLPCCCLGWWAWLLTPEEKIGEVFSRIERTGEFTRNQSPRCNCCSRRGWRDEWMDERIREI